VVIGRSPARELSNCTIRGASLVWFKAAERARGRLMPDPAPDGRSGGSLANGLDSSKTFGSLSQKDESREHAKFLKNFLHDL